MGLTIEIAPLPPAPYPKKWAGLFDARLGGRLLCTSRQPFLAAARVLVSEGHDPDTVLVMRHAGSQVDALKAKLGAAAKLTIKEDGPRFERWTPNPMGGAVPWERELLRQSERALP